MEEAGRIVEEILKYLREEGSVEREDIKDTFGLRGRENRRNTKVLTGFKTYRDGLSKIKNDKIGVGVPATVNNFFSKEKTLTKRGNFFF